MIKKLFYRPQSGVCADFIPFYDNDKFQLIFLRDYRDKVNHGEGTPWQVTITNDFVNFTEEVTILERGSIDEQDLYVFTGSVIKVDGVYHIFYTGHNPHLREKGLPEQAIMHAVSNDGINYTKIKEDTFFALSDDYEIHDWRDPFVYFDEEKKHYVMLFAARFKKGPAIRRGCTLTCTSKDLKKWELGEPLWAPDAYFAHECPDFFKIGDWYYLIFSEFTDQCKTRYRMSKDGKTWIAPKVDTFDGRAFYAAKSATDGNKRYLFGWIPTKDNNDYGNWHWGGSLAVHEIYQGEDGCLYERMPKSVYESFTEVLFESKEILLGNLNGTSTHIFGDQPRQFLLECDIEADDFASKYGLLISYTEDTDQGYAYSIDNHAGSFNLSEFPNTPWRQANFINVYRKLESKKTYKLQLIFEDNVAVAYLDDKYALSVRLYPENMGNLKFGLLSNDGLVKFKNLVVKLRK